MIDLRDGKITDLINNQMAYNPETISIGYAILQEKQRLIALAERTRLMAVVENLDEWVLDYLAVELRVPAYEDSFPKRSRTSPNVYQLYKVAQVLGCQIEDLLELDRLEQEESDRE